MRRYRRSRKPRRRFRPRRRFNTRRRRVRPAKRKAFGNAVSIARWPSLGRSRKFNLKYVQEIQLSSDLIGGFIADHVFRANSVYDPDFTGGGHQPYGFDQLMPNWFHFCVIASRIRIEAVNNQLFPMHFAIALRSDSTNLNTFTTEQILEQPAVKAYHCGYPSGSNTRAQLTMGFSAKKHFNIKNIQGNRVYMGDIGNNPAETAYFHVMRLPQGNNTADNNVVYVTIDYVVIFSEPRIFGPS